MDKDEMLLTTVDTAGPARVGALGTLVLDGSVVARGLDGPEVGR